MYIVLSSLLLYQGHITLIAHEDDDSSSRPQQHQQPSQVQISLWPIAFSYISVSAIAIRFVICLQQ